MRNKTLSLWLLSVVLVCSCVGPSGPPRGQLRGKIAAAVYSRERTRAAGETALYVFPLRVEEYPLIGPGQGQGVGQWSGWSCPRWSPDGRRLAVVNWDVMAAGPGPYGEEGVLYTVNSDGSDLTMEYPTNSCAAWSSDGRQLLFYFRGSLRVLDTTRRQQATILIELPTPEWGRSWAPDWSPDGTRIVYSTGDTIWEMNSDGTDPVPLAGPCEECNLENPRYSPSGERVVFGKFGLFDDGRSGIYVANADGSSVTWLHSGSFSCWSPDGSQIAFKGDPDDGDEGILAMNADGSDPRPLFGQERWVYVQFDWGP